MLKLNDPALLRTQAYIDGRWSAAAAGAYALQNPANGTRIAEIPRCGATETQAAIEAAQRAFDPWKSRTARQRAEILHRWYELMQQHRDDIAAIITLEEGKPLAEARGEVDYASSFIQWFSEEAKRTYGEVIPAPREATQIVVLREPVGVCAAITPWNFPAAMITRKAGPALAAGCTMVVKPAEQTPLTALTLAELAERAGIPAGVFNVVTGAREDAAAIGTTLTGSDTVRKITFTGSTAVGRVLLGQSASTIKKASMELGGNAPFIVLDDANLDAAVEGLMVAKFRNTGQSCIGANRVYLQDSIHDAFLERFLERVRKLKVGDGFAPDSQIGPLISQAAVAKVEAHIADALAQGARLRLGGVRHALGGCFFEPTVLENCHERMRFGCEESFGPLVPVCRFATDEEVIARANDTPYGLAAYLFSQNATRLWRMAGALETGMLGINCGLISNEVAPFGGIKQSGLGREGSRHGIDEYLESKYLCWQMV